MLRISRQEARVGTRQDAEALQPSQFSWWTRFRARWIGPVKVGTFCIPGPCPFYLHWCSSCRRFEITYPTGHAGRLRCNR